MRKYLFSLVITFVAGAFVSCDNEQQTKESSDEPIVDEVSYVPVQRDSTIDLTAMKHYNYFDAPINAVASSVEVFYDKTPYSAPTKVVYTYDSGDTFTYLIPSEFGLWVNESGFFRVVTDSLMTVWMQGQTKDGKLIEFVFFGTPDLNGSKIKPNSYFKNGKILYHIKSKPNKIERCFA